MKRSPADFSAEQNAHFEERSDMWSGRYRTNPSFRARLAFVGRMIEDSLTTVPHARVLDFGGGTGVFSMLAAQHAETVLCIDRSSAMLQSGIEQSDEIVSILADAGFDRPATPIERMVGDEYSISSGTEPYDLVLAIAILEYIDDCDELIRHLAGALRPGGLMILTVPNPASPLRWLQRISRPLATWSGRWSHRMSDQSFVGIRPYGDYVPWKNAATNAGLQVERVTFLPLGVGGARRMIHPNLIVSLRVPEEGI